jgi:hypothetical protein
VPNVEDRLPLLVQKQLDAKIRQRPPLFPWETKLEEYETTEDESGNPKSINIPSSASETFGTTVPVEQRDQ